MVRQLLTCLDGPRSHDPDRAVRDANVTVGPTGMIDESRDVAADTGVDDRPARQPEAPDMPEPDVPPLPLEALLIRDFLTCVIDDTCVLWNPLGSEYSPSVNPRSPFLDHSPELP
jgi:hypothetical protein